MEHGGYLRNPAAGCSSRCFGRGSSRRFSYFFHAVSSLPCRARRSFVWMTLRTFSAAVTASPARGLRRFFHRFESTSLHYNMLIAIVHSAHALPARHLIVSATAVCTGCVSGNRCRGATSAKQRLPRTSTGGGPAIAAALALPEGRTGVTTVDTPAGRRVREVTASGLTSSVRSRRACRNSCRFTDRKSVG